MRKLCIHLCISIHSIICALSRFCILKMYIFYNNFPAHFPSHVSIACKYLHIYRMILHCKNFVPMKSPAALLFIINTSQSFFVQLLRIWMQIYWQLHFRTDCIKFSILNHWLAILAIADKTLLHLATYQQSSLTAFSKCCKLLQNFALKQIKMLTIIKTQNYNLNAICIYLKKWALYLIICIII